MKKSTMTTKYISDNNRPKENNIIKMVKQITNN